jgi:hypothetical protein
MGVVRAMLVIAKELKEKLIELVALPPPFSIGFTNDKRRGCHPVAIKPCIINPHIIGVFMIATTIGRG